MKAVVLFFPAVILWVFSTANAKPAIATKSNQQNLQYTNVGDITAKDLMRIADESTPADKQLSITPEQTDNEIEAQTNQYYETLNNNKELASPKDQERDFLHLLKKQYRGIFPEYGKEIESNYAKNKELEDNLDVQPETALLGHSDEYHVKSGKSGNNEDNNDNLIPDDVPFVDNLDTFDSDSNVLNHERQGTLEGDSFHGKVDSTTKSPTTRHHMNQETDENEEIQNSDSTQGNLVDVKDISEAYDKAKEATGIEDSSSGTDEKQDEALETSDDTLQELDRMKEKVEEEQLWDLQEKLRQNVSLNKKENEQEKTTKKQKPKKKDKSGGILKEFEELQGHNKNPADGQNGTIGNNKTSAETIKVKASPEPQKESGKKIKYIHTEDSQVTGDAILDFLDKLLAKDPKKLRHDVLSMAKEIQNEGDSNSNNEKAILADEKQKSEQSQFSNTKYKEQEKSGSFKNIDEEKERDGEKEKDEEKQTDEVKDKEKEKDEDKEKDEEKQTDEVKDEEKENDLDIEKEADKYIPNMEDKIDEDKDKEKDEEKQTDEVKDEEKENDTDIEKEADKYIPNMEDKIDGEKEKDEEKQTDEVKDKEKENDTDIEKEADKYIPNIEDKIDEEKENDEEKQTDEVKDKEKEKDEDKEKDEEKQTDEVKDGEKENDTGKEKKADKYIPNMEDKIDGEKEKEDDDQTGNDDYEDKEYNEFHDPLQDIYPDHDNSEATRYEPGNDSPDTGGKSKAEDDKVEKVKQKDEDKFDYEEFKEEALKMHNEFRKRHNAVALEWSDKLAKEATDGAVQLVYATRNSFKRELEKHGHNIAILPYLTKDIAKSAVEKWYSEITKFSFANPEIKPETRDFTQIIWKGSKEVGMGFAYSADKKKTLVVALYSPSGNNEHEIKNNLGNVNNDPYADIRKTAIGKHS